MLAWDVVREERASAGWGRQGGRDGIGGEAGRADGGGARRGRSVAGGGWHQTVSPQRYCLTDVPEHRTVSAAMQVKLRAVDVTELALDTTHRSKPTNLIRILTSAQQVAARMLDA